MKPHMQFTSFIKSKVENRETKEKRGGEEFGKENKLESKRGITSAAGFIFF